MPSPGSGESNEGVLESHQRLSYESKSKEMTQLSLESRERLKLSPRAERSLK